MLFYLSMLEFVKFVIQCYEENKIIIIIIVNIYNAPCLSKMTLLAQLCGSCIIVGK